MTTDELAIATLNLENGERIDLLPELVAEAPGLDVLVLQEGREWDRRGQKRRFEAESMLAPLGLDRTLLDNAGIVLRRADMWHSNYEALAEFHAAHGHTQVPRRTLTPAGIDLGAWVISQRARKSRLTSEQIGLLDQIAFCWNARQDAWHARYQEAADFKNQHSHLNATFHTPLGAWLYQQRKKHRAGRLTAQQEQLLNDLGALSDPADGTGA